MGTRPDRADRRSVSTLVGLWPLLVYPLLVMAPVLSPGTRHHVRNRFADADLITDFDGGIRLAYLLKSVTWPWSRSVLSGFPDGESLLRPQAVSQGIQLLAIHLFTRVFEPVFSMNLLVLIGWITTGLAVYGLGRRVGLERWWSIAAGVLAQMLPSMPTMAANFTSYVYIGVPIYVISRAIDMSSAPSRRNLVWMCATLASTLFFDPYWFFFALAACVVALAVNAPIVIAWLRTEPQWMHLVAIVLCLMPVLLVTALLSIGSTSSPGSSSRPVAVETARFVDAGLRSPRDWFRSGPEGLGVVLGAAGFGALVVMGAAARKRREPAVVAAAVVVVAMVALSTRTRIDLPWFRIGSAAEYARFAMPGVRFFQRAALVAEAMLCVFAVLGVRSLWHRRREMQLMGLVGALGVVSIVELSPYDRAISRRWDDFATIRQVLEEVPTPVVLAMPFERHERGWLELSMLEDIRSVNQLYSNTRADLITVAASRGPVSFAAYLASLGVTHVLWMRGDARFPTSYDLAEPEFVLRTTMMLDGYGDPDEEVGLYEVHADPALVAAAGADICSPTCVMGDRYRFLRGTIVLDFEGSDDDVVPIGSSYWAAGSMVRLQVPMNQLASMPYRGVVSVTIANVPCGTPRSVHLEFGDQVHDAVLDGDDRVRMVFPVSSTTTATVLSIDVDGPPCGDGPGGRTVMLEVHDPVEEPATQPLGLFTES
jgi:hypothetical protein